MLLRSIRDSISLLMPANAPRPAAAAGRNAAGSGINVHQLPATFEGGAASPALAANEQALEVVSVLCVWGGGGAGGVGVGEAVVRRIGRIGMLWLCESMGGGCACVYVTVVGGVAGA
jgi:hypothetical protein